MPEASLRLRILNCDRTFLGEEVEIRLHHMELTDERVVRAVASEDILIPCLQGAPRGLYRVEILHRKDNIISRFVNLRACGVTDLEVVLPASKNLELRFPGETGADQNQLQPGENLDVEVHGLRPCQAHDLTVSDASGKTLFSSTLLSNAYGVIERTALWPQAGLYDLQGKEQLPVEEALDRMRGQRFSVRLSARKKELARRNVGFAGELTRPLVVATDARGVLQNAVMAAKDEAFITALGVPFRGAARVFLVPRQLDWRLGDPISPVMLAGGRAAMIDAQVDDRGRIQRRIAAAGELQPGAYDLIIRQLRYGYEDDENLQLLASDLVTRRLTGLVVRRDFMFGKVVRGGCSNTMPMSGRTLGGRPYFEYTDTFQLGENVYGALDPLGIDPGLVGKMVALYVIPHKTPAQWTADASLNHLAVLGGNAAVQKFLTQPGRIQ